MFKRIETPPFELEFHGNSVCDNGNPPFSPAAVALILAASPQNITQLRSESFLRFYPDAKEGLGEERVSDVGIILEESRRHFGKLQELGICVPRYSSIIGKAPDRDKIAIYSLSDPILGKELDAPPRQDKKDILYDLAHKLFAYYEWAIFNDIPFCLSDITLLRQYMHGRPSRDVDEKPTENIYLVDIEPRVINNNIASGRKRVSFELWCLRTWVANIITERKRAQEKDLLLSKLDLLKLMVNAQAGIR